MSLYKLTSEKAFICCPCGKEFVVENSDLEAHRSGIKFPRCECGGRTTLVCYPIDDEKIKVLKESVKSRHIINHTLFKILIDSGRFADKNKQGEKFCKEDIDKKAYSLAKDLSDGKVIESKLNVVIEKRRKK